METNPNFDQYVQEIARQEVARAQSANNPGIPAQEPQPISLNIGGQTFNYANQAELERSLNNFVGQTANKLQELQQAQQQLSETPNTPGRYVTADDNQPAWDSNEFIERMGKDPREGMRYYLNHELFEGKSEDPIGDLRRTLTETELTKRSIAAYQFKENHPEFPGGAQFAQVIDKVREDMGLPYDYNGLEAAYLVAMQRQQLPNFYQPVMNQIAQQQIQQQTQQAQPVINPITGQQIDPRAWNGGAGMMQNIMQGNAGASNNPYLAPPSPNRGSGGGQFGVNNNVDFDNMSLPELENVLKRLGYPVQ